MQPLDRAERLRSAGAAGSSRQRSPQRAQPCWHRRPDGTRRRHGRRVRSEAAHPRGSARPALDRRTVGGRHPGERAGAGRRLCAIRRPRSSPAWPPTASRTSRSTPTASPRRAWPTPSPACGIDWSLLAGIGRVESNHGRFGGAILNADGTSTPRIIGPPLERRAVRLHPRHRRRPLGRRQRPTTAPSARCSSSRPPGAPTAPTPTATASADPFNINDAALGAAHYLCAAGGNLRTDAGQRRPSWPTTTPTAT